jgi:FkbM family methyltransferase
LERKLTIIDPFLPMIIAAYLVVDIVPSVALLLGSMRRGSIMSSQKKVLNIEGDDFYFLGISDIDIYFQNIGNDVEDAFVDLCRRVLSADSIVIDVGSNIGITTTIMSRFVSNGHVISIEPNPEVFNILELNIKQNEIRNVTPLQIALTDSKGHVAFNPDSAFGHLLHQDNQNFGSISVEATTLDLLVESLNLQKVDFIKIDVEGFEPNVIAGAKKTIARFQPMIYCELNSWCLLDHGGHNPLDFVETIFDDFEFVYMVNRKHRSSLVVFPPADAETSRSKARQLVHENIVRNNSWDDLIFFNEPQRLSSPFHQQSDGPILEDKTAMVSQDESQNKPRLFMKVLRKMLNK